MKVLDVVIFYDVGGLATTHKIERDSRLEIYKDYLSTTFTKCFRVDKGHKNGDEIHCINKYGLVYIYNYNSKKLITILHPRKAQIERYYKELNIPLSEYIKQLILNCEQRNREFKLNEV